MQLSVFGDWVRRPYLSALACVAAAALIGANVGPAGAVTGQSAPVITFGPASLVLSPRQPGAFYASAAGQPSPSVRWQVSTPSVPGFTDIRGAVSRSFHFTATAAMNGFRYRALFTNSAGRVWTAPATLTVRPGLPGPFVELLFSRSEITAADNCVRNDTGAARLDSTIEPYLASLGLAATGSVETSPTLQSANWCTHYKETLAASWDQMAALGVAGWTFVSHSADYPADPRQWSQMSPLQMWQETCGSAQVIDAHGLKGSSDLYLWPNQSGQPGYINQTALTDFVVPCFGTSRVYGAAGLDSTASMATSPYRQYVQGANGGACRVTTAPCAKVSGFKYRTPDSVIAAIKALKPGQVMTIQVYLLVTGKSPTYSAANTTKWDCTSSDSNLHWSNDIERYCWSDLQQILTYLAKSGVGITQPGIVNAAIGRTGYSDRPVPAAPASVTASVAGEDSATVQWVASPPGRAGTILNYTVMSSPAGITVSVPGAATKTTVGGLGDGVSYTFRVTATSKLGTSVPSLPSNPITTGSG